MLELAEQAQAAVREKVHAQSWQVFWHIAIDGWTTRETADAMNMSYLAAHAAHKRVADPGLVIERELGRGGASVVYLAWEPALNRHVAVKLFPSNSLVDPHTREHWLGEARVLSRVPHDHVVAIHRVDETENWLWLVIEYVPGGTLKDRLREPLPPRDAARLTEIIARAVGYFHTRGVVHLDLKPSNILLEGEPGAPGENRNYFPATRPSASLTRSSMALSREEPAMLGVRRIPFASISMIVGKART